MAYVSHNQMVYKHDMCRCISYRCFFLQYITHFFLLLHGVPCSFHITGVAQICDGRWHGLR